jgi:hypothetical protein
MAKLRVISGPLAGQTIEVENELVFGRQDTDITIDDLELSRRHAVVRRHANRLQVEDLGSSNGTFVDGNRIDAPTLLGGGAEIRLGVTVLVVEGVLPVQSEVPGDPEAALVDDLDRQATRVRAVPPPPPTQETAVSAGATTPDHAPTMPGSRQPASPPAAAALPQAPSGPLTEFRPPERPHQRGLATRSWIPVVLSFGTVILTAIALVIYFAAQS